MIAKELFDPKSIVVVGASDNRSKPGGKVLYNLIENNFEGEIFAVNPKRVDLDGIKYYSTVEDLPFVDLAIIAIPAELCLQTCEVLALQKKTKAFIIFSAGFSEVGNFELENKLRELIQSVNGVLIGPNCIGSIQKKYKGVFTSPIPTYYDEGCELISSSGATAVFIMEAAITIGLKFSNIYSIGNGLQCGAEEILEHMDESFVEGQSSKIKLLYLEQIRNPFKFLKHASSLISKGCKIAAIKSGISEEGSRAASSHTGALASSDIVVRALFKKCGIVYCSSREELISVAGVFQTNEIKGKNFAVITHAGGSAVMLTDTLTTNGLNVPSIDSEKTKDLLKKLHHGSSVSNPFDFLATGTAEHLGEIIDFCENETLFDAMVVVFGSPGLFNVKDVYLCLLEKMKTCKKPIFTVLPSVINAKNEIEFFLSKGKINFSDEVVLGHALANVYSAKNNYLRNKIQLTAMDFAGIRNIINASDNQWLQNKEINELMQAAGIELPFSVEIKEEKEISLFYTKFAFPLVMKVQGVVHKTEVNGVRFPIQSENEMLLHFKDLMQIQGATSVLIQPFLKGEELYCGAIKQGDFGHLVLAGLGGVFLELLHDTSGALAPIDKEEAKEMLTKLKAYPIIKGYRNKKGINEESYIDLITRLAALVYVVPEIEEIDLNPIIATEDKLYPVDIRIRIQ
ncbi:MAG: acetate--CoA ligase family protein [Flavobacteriia bacterium]|nr:acetate--CoA ligase family protein [Flavobacteriia bacterium]